jgi:hypothetical protein
MGALVTTEVAAKMIGIATNNFSLLKRKRLRVVKREGSGGLEYFDALEVRKVAASRVRCAWKTKLVFSVHKDEGGDELPLCQRETWRIYAIDGYQTNQEAINDIRAIWGLIHRGLHHTLEIDLIGTH